MIEDRDKDLSATNVALSFLSVSVLKHDAVSIANWIEVRLEQSSNQSINLESLVRCTLYLFHFASFAVLTDQTTTEDTVHLLECFGDSILNNSGMKQESSLIRILQKIALSNRTSRLE
jgi:hypothetical protein